jgi:hypothetical protein
MKSTLYNVMTALVCASVCGCAGIRGTVIDRSDTETKLIKMTTSSAGTITVITGGAVREIPLKSFSSLTLYPEYAATIEGRFCYAADIDLRDGASLKARDKGDDKPPKTFVCVTATVSGVAHKGSYSAGLTDVRKLTVVKK